MKEARYVIRLGHSGTHTPVDQAQLLTQARHLAKPLGGTVMNLRVSDKALEFDLFCSPETDLNPFLTALEQIGPVLTYKQLDVETPKLIPGEVIAEARTLFNEQRFWEVHEVLEGLWKKTSGDEKQLLQGLILTAAALVHAQKNEPKVIFPMLEDAVRRLTKQPDVYFGLDVRHFTRAVKKAILTKNLRFPTI